jgi:hypothetical protein
LADATTRAFEGVRLVAMPLGIFLKESAGTAKKRRSMRIKANHILDFISVKPVILSIKSTL